jgi:hypothetical protein
MPIPQVNTLPMQGVGTPHGLVELDPDHDLAVTN